MAIYADKKNGKPTGRWRVELQRGKERYRKRHESFQEAQDDEKRVQALWATGGDITAPVAPQVAPKGTTIDQGIKEGQGLLWRGLPSEECNWAHVRFAASVLGGDTLLNDIDVTKVNQVVREFDKLGKADGTLNRYLSHLKTFLQWAVGLKLRTVPVDIAWPWRKESRGRIRWLSFEEETTLLSLVPENVGKLIRVAIQTGCRRDELITVEPKQIEGTLLHLWKTKTNSPRTVPMTEETAGLLKELVEKGTMPTRRTLRRQWDKAKDKMGLAEDEDFVFHACRHTCATRLLEAGVDVLIIKEWLGHKRIETTQRYTHVRPQNLQDALLKVGNLNALAAGKPQISAPPTAPHSVPQGGVNDEMSLAA